MFMRLLMLFILVPVVEIYILVKVGEHIGAGNTVALVILTGIVGAALAKSQGAQIIFKIRSALHQGQIPGRELLQGGMVLAGGIMLLTPGFLTDLFGLSLLLPLTRKFYTDMALNHFRRRFQSGHWFYTSHSPHDDDHETDDVVIEHPKIDDPSEHQ